MESAMTFDDGGESFKDQMRRALGGGDILSDVQRPSIAKDKAKLILQNSATSTNNGDGKSP